MASSDTPIGETHTKTELERRNRLYTMLSHINRCIIRTKDPQELYVAACRIAIESGGFAIAWIGLIDSETGSLIPVASAGNVTVTQLKSLNEGKFDVLSNDKETAGGSRFSSWIEMSEQLGLLEGASFPIRLEGKTVGSFNIAAKEPGFFRDAEINLLLEVVDDISFALDIIRREEKRTAAESKMRYFVYYDSQTGLPSRALFEERLNESCYNGNAHQVVVMVVNLRRLQIVLHLLEPNTGLAIIRTLVDRLESVLPAVPRARIDEAKFALLLQDPEGLHVAEELAWEIHKVLAEAVEIDGQEYYLDPFIGIARFPLDGEPAEVLKHAILAASSPDTDTICRFFFADMDEGSRRQLNLDTALRRALERNEFILHYQPQLDLSTGRIIGAEALLRWQSRDYGLVSPLNFIPLLEENGMINTIGEWVLQEACRLNRKWQDEGLPPLRMAVNLSARQFHGGDIPNIVKRTLEKTGLEPQWLELELTESIVLMDADKVIRTMHEISAEGIGFALDDFGTGYSSLSYLQRLPVARIKIDKSFVANLTSNPSDAAIVRAVVGMAHSLGLKVIAEGVETEGQLGFLRGINCEEIQGYLFSRPLPADDFTLLLREGRSIPPKQIEKPERVLLLIDDESNIISALTRVLRRKGFRIVGTTSIKEGFELMAIHQPGVVICDQRMPEMTGTEFLRRIKDIYPDTIRIVLSGYTELNSVIDAVNHGEVYKFLTKPWEDEALCQVIGDAFNIYELRQENRYLSRKLNTNRARSE
ncbi:EAL domain-containing protein [Methylotuvimicrobium buryatense]|uniref:cyclic-guanylate-specific phosphodiesterase n=1 Tax=Methylotuvimicrobium buryatense TaxID=95641 RepID=A0A4V1IKB0_METBY|nr:EAL domain-containing protein [Methylotuvimicrobium buryatense]QCW84275.1 EAL domain-containing protein [Methylotuvimicrobium buryatense]